MMSVTPCHFVVDNNLAVLAVNLDTPTVTNVVAKKQGISVKFSLEKATNSGLSK
jgi:hypothetical protein